MKLDTAAAKRLAEKFKRLYKSKIKINRGLYGSSPPFPLISAIKYPIMSFGTLISEDPSAIEEDNPLFWDANTKIEKIIEARLKFINAFKIVHKSSEDELVLANASVKEVDIEAKLKNIKFNANEGFYLIKARTKKIKVISNPKIPMAVEKLINDDLKAKNAIIYLFNKGFSDYYISKVLSIGLLGSKSQRKLVPSKWSITATHKTLIGFLRRKIQRYKQINAYLVFKYKILGNIFYNIVLPGAGNFELLEVLKFGSIYNLKFPKDIIGRDDESGGYYAAYLSFLEYMNKIKKRADGIVIRIVTPAYSAPLGVSVVREGVKKGFYKILGKFNDKKELVKFLKRELEKYNVFLDKLLKYDKILFQKRLTL